MHTNVGKIFLPKSTLCKVGINFLLNVSRSLEHMFQFLRLVVKLLISLYYFYIVYHIYVQLQHINLFSQGLQRTIN